MACNLVCSFLNQTLETLSDKISDNRSSGGHLGLNKMGQSRSDPASPWTVRTRNLKGVNGKEYE